MGRFYWAVEIPPGSSGTICGIEAHSAADDPADARADAIEKIKHRGEPIEPWLTAECTFIGWGDI